jgi:hypothetical protein
MTELWFVFEGYEREMFVFNNRISAEAEFSKITKYYEDEARRTGDWETPVDVYIGRVYKRAGLSDVELDISDVDDQTANYAIMEVTDYEL